MVAQWPPPAQEAVWLDAPDNLVSGILIPLLGRATKVAEGYRLTGQWPFVSGVNNADWCFLSGMVGNADGGLPEERYFLVPRRTVRRHRPTASAPSASRRCRSARSPG